MWFNTGIGGLIDLTNFKSFYVKQHNDGPFEVYGERNDGCNDRHLNGFDEREKAVKYVNEIGKLLNAKTVSIKA